LAEPNTVRIVQTHDTHGAEAPAEFERQITNKSWNTLGFVAMTFLRTLNPVRTTDPLVFLYTDPAHGSGWFRLEGFRPEDAQRISGLVQVEEISRVIGYDPVPKDDLTSSARAVVPRSSNPWFALILGAVVTVLGSAIFMDGFGSAGVDMLYLIMGALLAVAGIGLLVAHIIRAVWWHRARAYAKATGQKLPPDLSAGL